MIIIPRRCPKCRMGGWKHDSQNRQVCATCAHVFAEGEAAALEVPELTKAQDATLAVLSDGDAHQTDRTTWGQRVGGATCKVLARLGYADDVHGIYYTITPLGLDVLGAARGYGLDDESHPANVAARKRAVANLILPPAVHLKLTAMNDYTFCRRTFDLRRRENKNIEVRVSDQFGILSATCLECLRAAEAWHAAGLERIRAKLATISS